MAMRAPLPRMLPLHDALSGLPRRPLLLDRLRHALTRADRDGRRVAVMSLALEGFGAVGLTHGSEVADRLLREVAGRLSACLRAADTVARVGGDEFVLLLEDIAEAEDAAGVAGNLLAVLALPQEIAGRVLGVGATIGIALHPDDGDQAEALLQRADAALAAARREGRGRFRFFQAALSERASRRLELEAGLGQALKNGELELYYQPVLDLDTGLPRGVEALLRWTPPGGNLVMPGDFLPIAEAAGLIEGIGERVGMLACRQLADWQGRGWDLKMAVNVSARQLQQADLAERIAARLREAGADPAGLQVEVGGATLMAASQDGVETLRCLRAMGLAVVVDDFGAGGIDFARLGRLPVDGLKLAPGLAAMVPDGEAGVRMVRGIVALAGAMGFDLVAKGVESREQADCLRACGCTAGQGIFFARPEAADVVELWLATRGFSRDGA